MWEAPLAEPLLDSCGAIHIIPPMLHSRVPKESNLGTPMLTPIDPNSTPDPQIQDARFFAAMGYFNLLCFVPLILKKDNKFAQFHGKQGLVLFILEIAASILKVIPALGGLVFTVAFVVFGILSVVGVMKVLMGEYWEMPVIYEISNRISL